MLLRSRGSFGGGWDRLSHNEHKSFLDASCWDDVRVARTIQRRNNCGSWGGNRVQLLLRNFEAVACTAALQTFYVPGLVADVRVLCLEDLAANGTAAIRDVESRHTTVASAGHDVVVDDSHSIKRVFAHDEHWRLWR